MPTLKKSEFIQNMLKVVKIKGDIVALQNIESASI